MKNKKGNLLVLLLIGLGITTAQAQQVYSASGGDASGSGGTAAYSIGQMVYTSNTGANGSVIQGVQQPLEISMLSAVYDFQISPNIQAFPNPTSYYLQLKVESEKLEDLTYQLIDVSGKVIENKRMTSSTETIHMENLPNATYFLKVVNSKKEVKTFTIIKN